MQLFIKDGSAKIEITEIECVPEDAKLLIFLTDAMLKKEDVAVLEESLSRRTGKRCVVIGGVSKKVVGVKM